MALITQPTLWLADTQLNEALNPMYCIGKKTGKQIIFTGLHFVLSIIIINRNMWQRIDLSLPF